MSPTQEKKDVVIIQATNDLPQNLRESLHANGFASYAILDPKEAFDNLRKLQHPIICVFAGSDSVALDKVTTTLQEDARLHNYPLLLVGNDAPTKEKGLTPIFTFVMTLGAPFKARDIIDGLIYIRDSYDELVEKEVREKQVPKASHLPADEQKFADFEPHSAYTQIVEIPSLLFTELSSMNLFTISLAGGEYVSAGRSGTIQDKSYLPTDSRVMEKVSEVCKSFDSSCATHLHRVAFLAHRIGQAISLKEQLVDDARTASFLYAWAIKSSEAQLLKQDILGQQAFQIRKRLAESVAQSGVKIGTNLQKPVASSIVANMAKLISREKSVTDDEIGLIVSTIMAADMIDRTCYYMGRWNPRGAYSFMHNARTGNIKDIHPKVLACMIKIVSESASSFSPAILVKKTFRDDPILIDEAKRTKALEPAANEEKLPLSALSPGMKISRPVKAFDGRLVLDKDMVLDHDLIWRIWQLSAVRPLNQPLMVIAPQD